MNRTSRFQIRALLTTCGIFISLCLGAPQALASNEKLGLFLRTSAYGAAYGAGAGVVSLAFSDQPGRNLTQIARGTSLGLYAGMAVGLYLINRDPVAKDHTQSFWLWPQAQGLTASYTFELN